MTRCRGVIDRVSGRTGHSGGQGSRTCALLQKGILTVPHYHLSAQRSDEKKCDEDHELPEPTRVMTEIADSGLVRGLPLPRNYRYLSVSTLP